MRCLAPITHEENLSIILEQVAVDYEKMFQVSRVGPVPHLPLATEEAIGPLISHAGGHGGSSSSQTQDLAEVQQTPPARGGPDDDSPGGDEGDGGRVRPAAPPSAGMVEGRVATRGVSRADH